MTNRPNILLITSDQHRADALGCAGHPCIETPHLDALAYDGVRFENAYVDCPVCIPARTTLITGIQSHIYGQPNYAENHRIERDRDRFLGSLITQAGYQTQLLGKSHWHTEPRFRAGFEGWTSFDKLRRERLLRMGRGTNLHGIGANECHPTLSKFPPELAYSDWLVDQAFDFLDSREREQPFFLWVSNTDPHPPFEIHEPYYSYYANSNIPDPVIPDWLDTDAEPYAQYVHRWSYNPGPMSAEAIWRARCVYYGMITNYDHQLGRLFGKLIRDGLWDNTWIIYTSDHGEHLGDRGDLAKSSFFNSGANVPFIVRPPRDVDAPRGSTHTGLVEWADMLPTLCQIAGATAPDDITGSSFHDLVTGQRDTIRADLHGQIGGSHMFHTGDYKYLYFIEDGTEMLFDAINDREERHNLTDDTTLLASIRQRFIEHLLSENHDHIDDDTLLNQGRIKPTVAEARRNIGAFGLAAATMSGIG